MMNWKELCADVAQWAEAHRDEFVKDVSDACRIRSTSYYDPNRANMPFGKACRDMLEWCFDISKKYGFSTRNYDYYCGSAVYGNNENNDSIGIVAHMDIVPEHFCNMDTANGAGGWTHDPFDPILSEDGKYLFARGTADNKSCGIMALYAMRYLKEKGIQLKNNVMLVYGLSEEIGMHDMREFMKREKMSKIFLVPDSKYPVCIAEAGSYRYGLETVDLTGVNIVDLWCGETDEWCSPTFSVPTNEGWAVLSGVSEHVAKESLQFFENTRYEMLDDGCVKVIVGKTEKAPASHNLCHVLAKCGLVTGNWNALRALNWLDWYTSDATGEHMGIACNDGPSDPLSIKANYLRLEDNKIVLYTNIRWPSLADKEALKNKLEEHWASSPMEVRQRFLMDGYYMDPKDPRIEKLARVAKDVLGREDIPYLTDGGTYAEVLPNAIPYGATVPDRVRLFGFTKGGAHQADEYCDIPNLLINMQIYVRALIELDEMYSE
ncbi:MAG: Sapep family Mn(2+)-dependent dipeptidase [Oscillospiraceae bacterium]|nr:Sapep family Mn(2+)-dependent dipeptidase [Oscillospiraceae bacterium]